MPLRTLIPNKHPQTPPINRQLQQNPRPKPRQLLPLIGPSPRQRPKNHQPHHSPSRSSSSDSLPLRRRIRKANCHTHKRQIERKPRHEARALERRARRRDGVEDLVGHCAAHVLDGPGEAAVADCARDVEEVAEEVEGAAGDYEEVLDEEVGFGGFRERSAGWTMRWEFEREWASLKDMVGVGLWEDGW
jgi:hypothetical protein